MRLLLVCGGRWYAHPVTRTGNTNIHHSDQYRAVWRSLNQLLRMVSFDGVVEGGATGADTCAHAWAMDRRLISIRMPPRPDESPLARNERMWRLWHDRILGVAAFPGGEGTENMVSVVEQSSPVKIWRLPTSDAERLPGL